MKSTDNRPNTLPSQSSRTHKRFVMSFYDAGQGIGNTFRNQRNFRIELLLGIIAAAVGFYIHLTGTEWAVLILTISAVLTLEMLNTALESVVDLASPDYHPLAKIAKDAAAGAVLLASVAAVIIGVILFLNHW